jgi:DNA repair exonuclease SbcCD ATPase subunit
MNDRGGIHMLKGNITPINSVSGNIIGNTNFDHEDLLNRDVPNSHPIKAIEGLTENLESLKSTTKKLSKDLYSKTSDLEVDIERERTRALTAEDELEHQIKQVKVSLAKVKDENDTGSASKELIAEKLERLNTDNKLISDIETLAEHLSILEGQLNLHIDSSDSNVKNLYASVKTNNEEFSAHVENFDAQILKLNNLIKNFNKHVADYKKFIKENSGISNS